MKIREKLASQDSWIKGTDAIDRDGATCNPVSLRAVAFCLKGAAIACYPNESDFYNILMLMNNKIYGKTSASRQGIAAWNDAQKRTHAEVLDLVTTLDI